MTFKQKIFYTKFFLLLDSKNKTSAHKKSITFKHTKKEDQHIRKEDQHISLLNTQILKNAEKKKKNTQIKIFKFVCLKAKKHLFNTQNV